MKLGFDGVQDFKIAIASHSSDTEAEEEKGRKITVFSDIDPSDPPMVVTEKIVQSNILLLEKLVNDIDEEQLDKALDILSNTQLLHFAGQGGSSTLALNSYHKFIRAPIRCNYNSDYHMQLSNATKFTEEDTIILFSHSGETRETRKLAKTARQYGAKVIVFTGNPFCELLNHADAYFIISSKEALFKSESLNSQIVYITVVDILYVSFLMKNKEKSTESIQNIRKAFE